MRVGNLHAPRWTADEDRALRRYWKDGLTGTAIAARLGRTKNSVIARAHRLGLEKRGNPVDQAQGAGTREPGLAPERATPPHVVPDYSPCPRCGASGRNGCEHREPGAPAPRISSR